MWGGAYFCSDMCRLCALLRKKMLWKLSHMKYRSLWRMVLRSGRGKYKYGNAVTSSGNMSLALAYAHVSLFSSDVVARSAAACFTRISSSLSYPLCALVVALLRNMLCSA